MRDYKYIVIIWDPETKEIKEEYCVKTLSEIVTYTSIPLHNLRSLLYISDGKKTFKLKPHKNLAYLMERIEVKHMPKKEVVYRL